MYTLPVLHIKKKEKIIWFSKAFSKIHSDHWQKGEDCIHGKETASCECVRKERIQSKAFVGRTYKWILYVCIRSCVFAFCIHTRSKERRLQPKTDFCCKFNCYDYAMEKIVLTMTVKQQSYTQMYILWGSLAFIYL